MNEDIAQCFMDYADRLQFGNNAESQLYPPQYLDWIAETAGAFFDKHPHLLTGEIIETIAVGDEAEKFEQFGHLPEFHALQEALESYFMSLRPKAEKPHLFGFLRGILRWNRSQMGTKVSYGQPVNS